jgi:hypothetical protein
MRTSHVRSSKKFDGQGVTALWVGLRLLAGSRLRASGCQHQRASQGLGDPDLLSAKSSRLLAALNAHVVDGCSNLPVGINRYVEEKLNQQIVLCPLADEMKAPHGVNIRWEWRFEAEGVYG